MPARRDLESILIIGSGPIVIGQACEFDYSGTQAIKALKQEGYRIILVNSNPATIMTDPELADQTYLEPLTVEVLEQILEKERPDALLPTVGGQTALNLACQLWDLGILERYGVTLLGARRETVELAEDRLRFKQTMEAAGVPTPPAGYVRSVAEAEALVPELGLPLIIRPSFTLGGAGAGIAHTLEALRAKVATGLAASPVHQVLVERSVQGWKEFELEVMRDHKDQVVIICSIENLDPMGIHTGDSITVAPAQTLTDREYQRMRDLALQVIRAIGVETGGSNIQFAVDPHSGALVVIEMNPRVSRSSALASKATGFPIAKIAALLAVGYSLDELPNDITLKTPASFEPALDYVVVKLPRWDLEKFPCTDTTLGVSMKSVGEVMAIGRTFQEALQKAMRSLETGLVGFDAERLASDPADGLDGLDETSRRLTALEGHHLEGHHLEGHHLERPSPARLQQLSAALREGISVNELQRRTAIDPWFLHQMLHLETLKQQLHTHGPDSISEGLLRQALQAGFSDKQLARIWNTDEARVRTMRTSRGLAPVYKRVDTCAAEFEASTPYFYSCWDDECEAAPTSRRKILILGSGPNRIGQGIEFDYCCCHAAFALKALGIESLLINCNPETVSTDYDTADRLYFEPLTLQDVLEVIRLEKPEGVIVQLGGQTPLKLCLPLHRLGVPILGTTPEAIDLAEDRERFGHLLERLGIPQPPSGMAASEAEAHAVAERLGFPLLVRPSYVLGGKAMTVVHTLPELIRTLELAQRASDDRPVLIDRFLEQALELDIDAVADGDTCVIAGILEHIEAAGVHSGDSAAVLPPQTVPERHLETIRQYTAALARALNIRGLMNLQVAIQGETVYVLEMNPRASRTVPFVSKATGVAWAKVAARVLAGVSLAEQGLTETPTVQGVWVKEAVLPFDRFPEEDSVLGPEMKSTGEVMGVADCFGAAYAKALLAAGERLPWGGVVFVLVEDAQVEACVPLLMGLVSLGYGVSAPGALVGHLLASGIPATPCWEGDSDGKAEGGISQALRRMDISLAVCTRITRVGVLEPRKVRRAAAELGILCLTELSGASALLEALRTSKRAVLEVKSLQARTTRRERSQENAE